MEHGSYGPPLMELLGEVARFVREHEKEIVILDIASCCAMSAAAHRRLAAGILELFGPLLVPQDGTAFRAPLAKLWDLNQRVVVLYNVSDASAAEIIPHVPGILLRQPHIRSVWHNCQDLPSLRARLEAEISSRERGVFEHGGLHVLQMVVTPHTGVITRGILGLACCGLLWPPSLLHIGDHATPRLASMLLDPEWLTRPVNIFIMDSCHHLDAGVLVRILQRRLTASAASVSGCSSGGVTGASSSDSFVRSCSGGSAATSSSESSSAGCQIVSEQLDAGPTPAHVTADRVPAALRPPPPQAVACRLAEAGIGGVDVQIELTARS